MLGKLIKNEWKSTWKVPTAVCIYLGALTLLGCLSFLSPLWHTDNNFVGVLAGFSMLVYIVSLVGICVTCFVYFVARFYKNMYTDQGYLMHTLPVQSWEHIVSKGLVFFIWSLISLLSTILSIAAVGFTGVFATADIHDIADFWASFRQGFGMISDMFFTQNGLSLPTLLVMGLFAALLQLITGILMIYASISIGQLFNKHKVMASIITCICINFALQFISSMVTIPVMLIQADVNATFREIFSPTFWSGIILDLVCAVVFYFVTEYIMRKKLNLD